MTERKIVTAMVADVSMHEFEGSLASVLLRVQELINKHGPEAWLDYNAYFHYEYEANPSPRFELFIKRIETDKEFMDRLSQERQWEEQAEARDKAEFERLAKKFGVNNG